MTARWSRSAPPCSKPPAGILRPMPAPPESLSELEQQLTGRLVEFEVLSEAWPKAPRAVDRARIGREHSLALDQIGSLQRHITVSRAETLADAAVQLRRLEVIIADRLMLSLDWRSVTGLVGSIRGAVERAADTAT